MLPNCLLIVRRLPMLLRLPFLLLPLLVPEHLLLIFLEALLLCIHLLLLMLN